MFHRFKLIVFQPAKVGDNFGPSWSTHWFQLNITVPLIWADEEVRLLWDSNSEAMIWKDGETKQVIFKNFMSFILSHNS